MRGADRSSMPLAGRVALVTGGARRIGAAIVQALAEAGADVVIHHRASPEEAREQSQRIAKMGRRAWIVQADLADPDAAARLMAEAVAAAGRVDVLVNSASVFPAGRLSDLRDETLHETMQVNAWSPLALSGAFVAQATDGASIVNVLDTRVHRLPRERLEYHLSKQTLSWLTRATALAFAPRVRVNGVAPGAILPPPGEDARYLERLGSTIPLRRHGDPNDVARAVIFLATSPFVTGVTIQVDGGEHLEAERHE